MDTKLEPSLLAFDRAWRSASKTARQRKFIGTLLFLTAVAVAVQISQFDPARLLLGLPRIGEFLRGMIPPISLATFWADLAGWYWGLGKWLKLLWTTVMMALFATSAGTVIGGALCFLAARNLGVSPFVLFFVRRVLEITRTVPDLVWALVFLFAFGLGPLAGALAIMVHTIGAQGKLFAEVVENADLRPLEGVRASGGTGLDEIRIGLLPQVLPNFVSYALWRFEINVRSATIIGFVGAGGIGMELYEAISLNYFDYAGAILIIVFLTVALIDTCGERLRLRLAGVGMSTR
ncbi:MAG: phosphonate ABC transporter, permease protein PhnE [Hyphomicrobium sp.]|nr:phosphonate ABC transporter, permease protein PhnE [Hyphomicrobium sp.]